MTLFPLYVLGHQWFPKGLGLTFKGAIWRTAKLWGVCLEVWLSLPAPVSTLEHQAVSPMGRMGFAPRPTKPQTTGLAINDHMLHAKSRKNLGFHLHLEMWNTGHTAVFRKSQHFTCRRDLGAYLSNPFLLQMRTEEKNQVGGVNSHGSTAAHSKAKSGTQVLGFPGRHAFLLAGKPNTRPCMEQPPVLAAQ